MRKSVVLPLFLLLRVVDLLGELEPPEYNESRYEYCQVVWALKVKLQKLECRKPYIDIIEDIGRDGDYYSCFDCAKLRFYSGKMDAGYFDDPNLPF